MTRCEPCQERGDDVAGVMEPDDVWPLCDHCRTSEAEAAYERMLSDYYGGSGPVTMDEHCQEAAKLDRSQR